MQYFLYFIFFLLAITSATVDVKGFESFPINPKNNETSIKVTKGSDFILVIFEDGTTDYNWYLSNLDAIDSSKTILPMNLDQTNTGEYEARARGGGYIFFKFQAIKSGNEIASFEYKKYGDINPLNKIFVNIEIIDISNE